MKILLTGGAGDSARVLAPALKPSRYDITETRAVLGYQPSFSLASLLEELAQYGRYGLPAFA